MTFLSIRSFLASSSLTRVLLISNLKKTQPKASLQNAFTGSARQSSSLASFQAADVEITPRKYLKKKPDPDNLVFGKEFADHMLTIDWTRSNGWDKPKIGPFENFSLSPATKVFHYAVELFEGMKAYRGVDNKIRIFRPDLNMTRMKRTAIRSCLPDFDGEELIKLLKKLLTIDQEWVPYSTTSTLYIRPTMIGTDYLLSVAPPTHARLFVILSPVGPYYPSGFEPVSLLADPKYVRSWEGGCGQYKMGANYAPTMMTQLEAVKKNCQQVLWLYGPDHQVTEVGAMNMFLFWTNPEGEKELVTPPLDTGLILPGVTRKSILEIAEKLGEFKVSERSFTMLDIVNGVKEDRVHEMFGAGTACVIAPVAKILYKDDWLVFGAANGKMPLAKRMLDEILDIQYGRKNHPWAVEIN